MQKAQGAHASARRLRSLGSQSRCQPLVLSSISPSCSGGTAFLLQFYKQEEVSYCCYIHSYLTIKKINTLTLKGQGVENLAKHWKRRKLGHWAPTEMSSEKNKHLLLPPAANVDSPWWHRTDIKGTLQGPAQAQFINMHYLLGKMSCQFHLCFISVAFILCRVQATINHVFPHGSRRLTVPLCLIYHQWASTILSPSLLYLHPKPTGWHPTDLGTSPLPLSHESVA
jgi:hypothetical protein